MTLAKENTKPGGMTLLHWLTASHARASLFLAMAALALFLPGFFTLHPMDRDEPRFAQATKQMLETGDFVAIRFQDEARNKKPVGIYWLQATSVKIGETLGVRDARRQIWLYRLPSLLAAVGSVLLTYWVALAFLGRTNALLAALLLGSTVLVGVEARLAKTDATILATVLAAMGAFARVYLGQTSGHPWRLPAIFWTAIGIGLLVKGPITPMIPLFAGVFLAIKDRGAPWLGALKPLPGLAWAVALVLPWFVMIMIQTQGAFLADSVGADMLGKVASGKEAHGAPPLTYFAAFWGTAWPMAPLAALAAPFVWKLRKEKQIAFLAAWILPAWIMFEAVPTKLPHYVLPLYPAIAILIALAIEKNALKLDARWRRAILWLVPMLAILLLAGAAIYADWRLGGAPGWLFWLMGPCTVALSIGYAMANIIQPVRVIAGTLAAGFLYVTVYSGLLTAEFGDDIAISPRLATSVSNPGHCRSLQLATAGYYEPSLVFLTDTNLTMTNGAGAAEFLRGGPCRAVFVEERQEPAFREALSGVPNVNLREHIVGTNINGGRRLVIGVWVRPSEPPAEKSF